MKNRLFLSFAVVVMAIVATSCGKMPQENMDAAKSAIEAAKTAQADVYMSAEFKALEDSLAVVMQGIEAENSKFLKNFDGFKANLETLTAQAETLAADMPAKKEAVKAEAVAKVAEVKTAIEATKSLLAKAPKGKEGKAALEQISGELTAVATTVDEVEASLAGDVNFMEALNKLNAAQKTVSDIDAELNEAIAKKAGK